MRCGDHSDFSFLGAMLFFKKKNIQYKTLFILIHGLINLGNHVTELKLIGIKHHWGTSGCYREMGSSIRSVACK